MLKYPPLSLSKRRQNKDGESKSGLCLTLAVFIRLAAGALSYRLRQQQAG